MYGHKIINFWLIQLLLSSAEVNCCQMTPYLKHHSNICHLNYHTAAVASIMHKVIDIEVFSEME